MTSHQRIIEQHDTVHTVVAEQLALHAWALVSPAELAEQVEAALAAGLSSSPANAVLFCYSQALYEACAGYHGRGQQEIAYQELFRFLYDITWRYAPDLSAAERQEVANYANAELYYRLAGLAGVPGWGVREPGAFLAVAGQLLRNAIRSWRRQFLQQGSSLIDTYPIPAALEPEHVVAARELEQRVRISFERVLQRHPRARIQLAVVWKRHIDDQDYPTLATEYGISIPNARVLYTRGMEKLRHDPDWQQLAHDLGLTGRIDSEQ